MVLNWKFGTGTAGRQEYIVNFPSGLEIEDSELITRCDNRKFDLDEPAGKSHHFGGYVERYAENYAKVTVWID